MLRSGGTTPGYDTDVHDLNNYLNGGRGGGGSRKEDKYLGVICTRFLQRQKMVPYIYE